MKCIVCGNPNPGWDYTQPVDVSLKKSWGINTGLAELFNYREGTLCQNCGVNLRATGLAKGILKHYRKTGEFSEWVKWANKTKLRVAEINPCHQLHEQLKKITQLTTSNYGDKATEDIQNLSYDDNTFDLVLHSETLEHIDDPLKALDECRRVIKDDGVVVFTIPMIWGRKTRRRAAISKGRVKNILPPAYHGYNKPDYLVFWEFGRDFINKAGCRVLWFDSRSQTYVLVAHKRRESIPSREMIKYQVLEKTAVLKREHRKQWQKKSN